MKPISPLLNTWSVRMTESTLKRYSLSNALWHYEHGLLVMAINKVGMVTGDPRFTQFASEWIDKFIQPDGGILTYRINDFNLDQINPGKLLFQPYKQTGEERFCRALNTLRDQMKNQPRTNSGGFWHKKIYPHQMWLDGIYMASPFLAEYAGCFDEPSLYDEVVHQIILIEKHARDPQTGLLYHAWDESKQQQWADPATGRSPHFWGRALGWFAMALVDVLDHLPRDQAHRPEVIEILDKTAAAILRVQDPETGLWYQVLDLPEGEGNYREASASAMFVYAFAKGVRKGYLSADYLSAARRGYNGLLQNLIKIDADGVLTLEGVCRVAGLGGQPYRDGSYKYYVNEQVVSNDPKGVGPFILAALEMENAGNEIERGNALP
ncbi:MAG: glycoside hydrolase family 88 protein [Chloroflexota bacterium]